MMAIFCYKISSNGSFLARVKTLRVKLRNSNFSIYQPNNLEQIT